MKTLTHPPTGPRGFALVSTLLLMALLTLTAVGFLSLSAISLRQSGNLDAQAQAKTNARLAIMVALGELQRTLGKDTAVTASSDLTLPPGSGQRHLTGVWDSWPVPLSGSPNYATEKDNRFRGWLVSDTDRTKPAAKNYPASNPTDSVELYTQDPGSSTGKVLAGVVKVGSTGAYAWHVADESVKARIDLSRDPEFDTSLVGKRGQLNGGQRPGVRGLGLVTSGTASFDFSKLPADGSAADFTNAQKVGLVLVNRGQAELIGGTKLPPSLRHDLTTHSLGVLADVANGGLKKDLTSTFEVPGGLPSELADTSDESRVYESTLGADATGVSDPYWTNLSAYYNLYKKASIASNGVPSLTVRGERHPDSTKAAAGESPEVPRNYPLAPVIQRLDLHSSIYVIRERGPSNSLGGLNSANAIAASAGYGGGFYHYNGIRYQATTQGTSFSWSPSTPPLPPPPYNKYWVDRITPVLIITPVITIHNPYNTELKFERITVVMEEPPLKWRFSAPGKDLRFQVEGGASGLHDQSKWMPLGQFVDDEVGELQSELPALRFEYPGTLSTQGDASIYLAGHPTWYSPGVDKAGSPKRVPDEWRGGIGHTTASPKPITMKPGQTLVFCPWSTPMPVLGKGAGNANTGLWSAHVKNTLMETKNTLDAISGSDATKSVPTYCFSNFLGMKSGLFMKRIGGDSTPAVSSTIRYSERLLVSNPIANTGNTAIPSEFRFKAEAKVEPRAGWTPSWRIATFVKPPPIDGVSQPVFPAGTITFTYGNNPGDSSGLKKLFADRLNASGEIVAAGEFTAESVSQGIDKPSLTTSEYNSVSNPWLKTIRMMDMLDESKIKTFATLSIVARSANGGVYPNRTRTAGADKNLYDGRFSGKPFVHENPAFASFNTNLDTEPTGLQSYELNFLERDGSLEDEIELTGSNPDFMTRAPAVTGHSTAFGIKSGVFFELPIGPMQTLAGFRRSNAFASSYLPRPMQPLSNSWAPPSMPTTTAKATGVLSYELLDHSYLANAALYDSYYFSTVVPDPSGSGSSSYRDRFESFARGEESLPNQCLQPWRPDATPVDQALLERLFEKDSTTDSDGNTVPNPNAGAPADETWREMAAWQMVKGSFNVNSTNVLAWKAMLASLADTKVPVLWAKSLGTLTPDMDQAVDPDPDKKGKYLVPSLTMPLAGEAGPDGVLNPDKVPDDRTRQWNGFRTLTSAQLDDLARKIVDEVRLRGPFLSMAEFVNRQLGDNSELTRKGALQSAIDKAQLNKTILGDIPPVELKDVSTNFYGYKTPESATGNPAEGAPGTVTQGDIMNLLEPRATVRGDTFVIRSMGRALDKAGNVTATAYAEAVVQRTPDYLDPADKAHQSPGSQTNKTFGRRFRIVSMRWLQSSEL